MQVSTARNIQLLFIAISIGAVWSLLSGQDVNWDLLNYHYYNPYALINGRLGFDIAPAQQQTYFNPALDVVPYLFIQWQPPWVVGAILGGWHGINFWLAYLIAAHLFKQNKIVYPIAWALLCTLVGMFGPVTVSEIGAMLHDLTVSVFTLGSILLILIGINEHDRENVKKGRVILGVAGLLLGLSVGLKLTTAIFAVGIIAASILTPHIRKNAKTGMFIFMIGVSLGFLLADGFWLFALWSEFGNPLFPMMNELFQSPYAEIDNLRDRRFIPKTIVEWLFLPFMFISERHAGMELSFQDVRVALFLSMLVVVLVISGYQYLKHNKKLFVSGELVKNGHWSARWFVLIIIFTYLTWLPLFSIYRYIGSLEYLAPIAILLILNWLVRSSSKYFKFIAVILLLSIVALMRPPEFGRIPWQQKYFGVEVPVIRDPERTIVLMSSYEPLSFVIPGFQKEVRFVRLVSNFNEPEKKTKMFEEIRSLLSQHRGDVFLLTTGNHVMVASDLLRSYGSDSEIIPMKCEPVPNRIRNDLVFCPVNLKSFDN